MHKTIFQTWREEPTGIFKKCADSWKEHNPEWTYIFLNDQDLSNIIAKINPKLYEKYEKDPIYIKKFDAYRYAYIYEFGGIYADIDILCHRSIDSLISTSNALLFEEHHSTEIFTPGSFLNGDMLTNSIFYFKPKDKFLKRLLYDLVNYTDILDKNLSLKDPIDYNNLSAIYETGPFFLTKTFYKYKSLYPYIDVESYSRFEHYPKYQRKQMVKDGNILINYESYGTHLNVGSWIFGENKSFSYYKEVRDVNNFKTCFV